jgi:ABC-type lipoprotein release transport system permease subunit
MRIGNLIGKEIWHSKLGSISSLVSVLVAIGCLVGAFTLLKAHDLRTSRLLEKKQRQTRADMEELRQEMRKATLELGFNVVILPKEQKLSEWYEKGYSTHTMPEQWGTKLAHSRITSVRHILPVLQKKIQWPEKSVRIRLLGTKGEIPRKHMPDKPDMARSVPKGKIVVGHALHQELDLQPGDTVTIRGTEFTVEAHRQPAGSEDDITVWMHLDDTQKLLGQEDEINAIIALQCMCTGINFAEKVRSQVKGVLPDTQVVIREARAMARARARLSAREKAKTTLRRERKNRERLREQREDLAAVLVPFVLAASVVWIGLTTAANVKERRGEIAVLRAVGLRSGHVMALFLTKAIAIGLVGGGLGYAAGFLGGRYLEAWLTASAAGVLGAGELFRPDVLILALALAPCLAAVATSVPALMAAYQDPADILSEE